jgi:hypothetical protein
LPISNRVPLPIHVNTTFSVIVSVVNVNTAVEEIYLYVTEESDEEIAYKDPYGIKLSPVVIKYQLPSIKSIGSGEFVIDPLSSLSVRALEIDP